MSSDAELLTAGEPTLIFEDGKVLKGGRGGLSTSPSGVFIAHEGGESLSDLFFELFRFQSVSLLK
jgi:hypothetical protein